MSMHKIKFTSSVCACVCVCTSEALITHPPHTHSHGGLAFSFSVGTSSPLLLSQRPWSWLRYTEKQLSPWAHTHCVPGAAAPCRGRSWSYMTLPLSDQPVFTGPEHHTFNKVLCTDHHTLFPRGHRDLFRFRFYVYITLASLLHKSLSHTFCLFPKKMLF